MKFYHLIPAVALSAIAVPAAAQDAEPPKPITVTGTVGLVSDYRFRGVSQSDKNLAVQGGFTIAHESGVYIGTWGSNLAGWGTFGGANMELDLIAGFKLPVGGGTLDVGATWYMYPGGFDNTDFIEPYVKLSGTTGPISLTASVYYAPKQEALGPWYTTSPTEAGYDNPGAKDDNLYVAGDISGGVPGTGLTAKAHIGYSKGNKGLGPFATSVAPTGEYADWLVGVDYVIPSTPLTLGVAYVDTDIGAAESLYLQPSFSQGQNGTRPIADATVVVSLTAAF